MGNDKAPSCVVETGFRVRYVETDMMGIVHHSNYLAYFEIGRVEFSRQVGAPYTDLEMQGLSLAVSEVSLRYTTPAVFDQLIVVRTWLERVRSRELTFGYEIVDAESREMIVSGITRLICVDRAGKPRRIPEPFLAVMEQTLSGPGMTVK